MKRTMYIAALSALVLASCAKEAPEQNSVTPVIEEQILAPVHETDFTASFYRPSRDSKTSITAQGDTLLVTWATDDPIYMSTGSSSTTLYVKEGGYTAAQLVTKTETISGDNYYAVYPDTLGVSYSSTDQLYTLMIPAIQVYTGGSFAPKSYPMVATCDDNGHNLSFRNVAALVKIHPTTEQLSGARVSKIILSATNLNMGGYFQYYFDGVNDPEIAARLTGSKTVTLNVVNLEVPLDNDFYIPVAPGDYENLTVTVVLDSDVQSVYTIGNKKLERSKYYSYTFNFEEYDGYTDISADETANTYIITTAGKYKFNALVKGNGAITSKGGSPTISGGYSASEYWSDGTQFVKEYKYAGGYIYFETVSGTLPVGTSLVSVRSVDNNTLWSWLIWGNSSVKGVKLSDKTGTWLNMNLGAHQEKFNTKGYNGYFYQSGRKDPLQQAVYQASVGAKETFGPKPWVSKASTTEGSISNSILNPTLFYGCYYPNQDTSKPRIEDWENYDDSRKIYDWWCQNLTQDCTPGLPEGLEYKKTMFDPCPAGYHVPTYEQFNNMLEEKTAGTLIFSHEGSEGSYNVTVMVSNGTETICFPTAGTRTAGILMMGVAGYYATVNPSSTNAKNDRKYHRFWFRNDTMGANTVMRAAGQSVRCIKGE